LALVRGAVAALFISSRNGVNVPERIPDGSRPRKPD
jgi:hypothetical protein